MKYILLLILLSYIKSLIDSYYTPCVNPPIGGFIDIGTSECRRHNHQMDFAVFYHII